MLIEQDFGSCPNHNRRWWSFNKGVS